MTRKIRIIVSNIIRILLINSKIAKSSEVIEFIEEMYELRLNSVVIREI